MDRTPSDDGPGPGVGSDADRETRPSETATTTDRDPDSDPNRDREYDPDPDPHAGDAGATGASSRRGTGDAPARRLRERGRETVDSLLPEAGVDSNWWYWIAAVPAYFVVVLGLGVAAVFLFLFAFALDVAGLGGAGSVAATLVATVGFVGLGLLGLAVAIMFPVATYVDARAVSRAARADGWRPDPAMYALAAAVAVVVTNFVLSVPLAVYYLYRRHRAVGVP